MSESIQNDGGFKGGETIVRARACALMQTPANSALNSRSNTVAVNRIAFEPDKVVTGVVRDLKSGRKPKYTRVSEAKFIGEQNRCICSSHSIGRTYPCPPAPHRGTAVNHKNIFRNFGGHNVH